MTLMTLAGSSFPCEICLSVCLQCPKVCVLEEFIDWGGRRREYTYIYIYTLEDLLYQLCGKL